jgi:hypothetical protein
VSNAIMGEPTLSVVVTIVDGGATLRACLDALGGQVDAPRLEVIVPFDRSVDDIEAMSRAYGEYHFLDLGHVETDADPGNESGRHELYDRRRAAGLAAARGEFVAILEDRGRPCADWAMRAVAALRAGGQDLAAVGGGVVNAIDRALNWAVYLCDFGRYQPPLAAGTTHVLTDINVCYRKAALEAIRSVWCERFHEPEVHSALEEQGGRLALVPEMLVEQHRANLRLGSVLRERYHWGRLYAAVRMRDTGIGPRLVFALLTPLLPLLLVARITRLQLGRPSLGRFCFALPWIILLTLPWSAGELMGYLTAR